MRKWDTADEIEMLGRAVDVLQKGGVLAPASLGLPSPLDLRGLVFPSVSQLTIADLPATVAKMIIGRREFNNAILQDVDLRDANLSFSAWHNCVFERVCFDKASMKQARFFGCRFANCSFRSADLRDASFTIGCDGAETEVCDTALYRANFRGASCSNPVFRSTSFANCKLEGFVFDGALCDNVSCCGSLEELTFRGLPNGGDRNCVRIDLSRASIIWLNVDYGIDLHRVILPSDDSCLILRSRLRAIECGLPLKN